MTQANAITNLIYRGKNQIRLQTVASRKEYKSNIWCTFLQARELGIKIKKGEHGTPIFKGYGEYKDKKLKDKNGKPLKYKVPNGSARVFNVDQTEKYHGE